MEFASLLISLLAAGYAWILGVRSKRLQMKVNNLELKVHQAHLEDREEAKQLASLAKLTVHPEGMPGLNVSRVVIVNRGQAVADDVRVEVLNQAKPQGWFLRDLADKDGSPIEPGERRVARYLRSKSDPEDVQLRVTWRDGAGAHSEDLVVSLRP